MAHIGHALVGDPVYGGRRRVSEKVLGPVAAAVNGFPRQALHAATLGFVHPVTGEEMRFPRPCPTTWPLLAICAKRPRNLCTRARDDGETRIDVRHGGVHKTEPNSAVFRCTHLDEKLIRFT
jgi:hypothetical protein